MRTSLSPNTVNILGVRTKVVLAHSSANRTGQTIYMKAIDQEEENRLDKRSSDPNLFFFGDIDLNNPADLKIIRDYNFYNTNYLGMVYNDFDYKAGIYKLVEQSLGKDLNKVEYVPKWGACIDPIVWFKFNHCLLGKPKKVVVYTEGNVKYWGR